MRTGTANDDSCMLRPAYLLDDLERELGRDVAGLYELIECVGEGHADTAPPVEVKVVGRRGSSGVARHGSGLWAGCPCERALLCDAPLVLTSVVRRTLARTHSHSGEYLGSHAFF